MRTRLIAGALALTAPLTAAAPAGALTVKKKRLQVRVGRAVVVSGAAAPASVTKLQIWRHGGWRTLDRDRAGLRGRFHLRDRTRRPQSRAARVVADGGARHIGRVKAFRAATASWYGPGLYGNRLACGGRLTYGRLGVAHKTLPCGTRLTLRKGRRSVRVRVIDRGPYVGGREFDLTQATARRLHFHGHGTILSTR